MPSCAEAVIAEGVRKRFGKTVALDGVNLRVSAGTVHGLLGPNGAGKTTMVRILTTLLRADSGRVQVAGCDVRRQGARVRSRIGLVGQHAAVDEILTGAGNLILFGRLYGLTAPAARRRAAGLLDQFGLTAAAAQAVSTYSGGMRRRLDIASSLILSPPVLFLDEPTTGLDPRGRADVWASARRLVSAGTTVLLTTQYLDEADQLADQISIIDAGRVIAEGSPAGLKSHLGGNRVEIVLRSAADLVTAAALVAPITGTPPHTDPDTRTLSGPARHRVSVLAESLRVLDRAGIAVEDITIRQPTLDEAFLHLTSHPSEPRPAAAGPETPS